MMDRFTDYARSVVWTGFRHQSTASERDIVAALASGRGVASRLLGEVGVTAGDLPATPVERQVLVTRAVEAARRRGANYVGTEHLLLAAATLPGSGLAARGASAERLAELLSIVEAEWRSCPNPLGRVLACCRSALRRANGRTEPGSAAGRQGM